MEKLFSKMMREGLIWAAGLLLLCGIFGAREARAETPINKALFKTSEMKAGEDYILKQDATIRIDQKVSIGMLSLNSHKLRIIGSTTLTLTGIEDNTGGPSGEITMESGIVDVEAPLPEAPVLSAVYLPGILRMKGGTFNVTVNGSTGTYSAMRLNQLIMSGGNLSVHANKGAGEIITGLYLMGNGSTITGGTVFVTSKYSGITVAENGDLSISGGKVTATGGSPTEGGAVTLEKGIGIGGYSSGSLLVTGGTVIARGGKYGIFQIIPEFIGTADVTASAAKSSDGCGIYSDSLILKNHVRLKAYGKKYAITTLKSKGGITIGNPLVIMKPEAGAIYPEPDGTKEYISTAYGKDTPATDVLIDYVDEVESVTVTANPTKVTKGVAAEVKCAATINGYAHNKTVEWSVSGNNSSSTVMYPGGTLKIASDETADSLTVRATSKADTSKYGEVKITLVKPSSGGSGTSGSGSGSGSSGGAINFNDGKTEEKILAPVKKEDAAAIKNKAVSKGISEATVNALPVSAAIPVIDAEKIVTRGSISKKKMTIYYDKVKGASNYIIAWKKAKSKKWKYYTTGDKGTFVIKKLKRKEMLEFKVAPYEGGRRGAWSATSYRYFENAKAVRERKGKKLTVTFTPVEGASGYQLLYADNKKMDGYKLKSVKKKTKITLKKLSKKKKYYIRWRPYKKYKGKKYLGVLKGVKKV